MSVRGRVRDGVVVLQPGVQLPENLGVIIEPAVAEAPAAESVIWNGTMRNGVPIFPPAIDAPTPDLELVNRLRDDAP